MSSQPARSWLNNTRGVELLLACLALVWGVGVLQDLVDFDVPAYVVLKQVMRETLWGAIFVLVGSLRLLMLGINGLWRRSPLFRGLGTLLSAMLWFSAGFLMLMAAKRHGVALPAGVLWYAVYLGFEGWCLVSAGYDMNKNGSLGSGRR